MARWRRLLIAAGAGLALLGLLWIAQGTGLLAWPRSSFMLGRRVWVDYGAGTAALGLALILAARRLRR